MGFIDFMLLISTRETYPCPVFAAAHEGSASFLALPHLQQLNSHLTVQQALPETQHD
jgi:hypothetical protein